MSRSYIGTEVEPLRQVRDRPLNAIPARFLRGTSGFRLVRQSGNRSPRIPLILHVFYIISWLFSQLNTERTIYSNIYLWGIFENLFSHEWKTI